MNSSFSKLEKSVEECIHYNFDNDLNDNQTETNLNLHINKDHKCNGQVNVVNWLDLKEKYPWLYVYNDNPNCTYCEQAYKNDADIVETYWTNPESPFDTLLDKAKVLKLHSKSVNHISAYNFMVENSLIEHKDTLDKDNRNQNKKSDIPNFMTKLEWTELVKLFPWLYFMENSFRCQLCEDGFNKQRKSMFPTQWTCPEQFKQLGNPSQKSLRSVSRFEKHQMSINHIKAIEILKECSVDKEADVKPYVLCSVKEKEPKRYKSPRKSLKFSPPNVTTRTATKKSLMTRDGVLDFMTEESWLKCQKEYPWIYCSKNILRCSLCEEAYKEHSDVMIPTIWTCPETATENNASSIQYIKSRFRLSRHENTKNHLSAVNFMSLSKPSIMDKITDVSTELEKKKEICDFVTLTAQVEAPLPTTVKASRKSAPVKLVNLSYDEKPLSLENSEKRVQNFLNSQRQMVMKISKSEVTEENRTLEECYGPVPQFLTESQFSRIKARYSWFFAQEDNSFGCNTCLEAFKISPNTMLETRFSTGVEKYEPTLTYFHFRKKLYRHSESRNHANACNILKTGCTGYQSNLKQSNQSQVNDSRFTRLKSGSRSKINYKLMSEGYIDNKEWKYSGNKAGVTIITKKRRDLSTTWKCPQCKSHFCNANDLIQHISLCDYQPSDSTKMLACPCNPLTCRFNTITKLDLHAAQEHDTHSYFHCYICSDRYNRLSSLFHHMLIHHLISWNPFDAYFPASPSEPFLCIFCNCTYNMKSSLVDHYCQSDCSKNLQPIVVLEDIMSLSTMTSSVPQVQEEIDIFDVDELPEDKEVVYSPIKKCRSHHNRIRRGHPLRRFGESRKSNTMKDSVTKTKESKISVESNQSGRLIDICNVQDVEKINTINDKDNDSKGNNEQINCIYNEESITSYIDLQTSDCKINNMDETSDDNVKVKMCENLAEKEKVVELNENNKLGIELEINKPINENKFNNESDIGFKIDGCCAESIPAETNIDLQSNKPTTVISVNEEVDNNLKSNEYNKTDQVSITASIKKPLEKVRKKRMSKKMKLNQLINELNNEESQMVKVLKRKYVRKSTLNSQVVKKSKMDNVKCNLKKAVNELTSFDNPNLLSADAKNKAANLGHKKIAIRIQSQLSPCKKLKTIDRNESDIPTGISFMDRMKKIRQLKKTRTEQQREQMMAVERKIAEIIEKSHDHSLIDKSERIRKLLNSERCSLDDLKTIIRKESKRRAEKRKSNHSNSSNQIEQNKQLKLEFSKPVTVSSLPKRLEIFSCNVCHLKFKSLRARDNHTTSDHKGLKLFCCKSCHLSFTTHILLRKHAQKYHVDNVSFAVFGKQKSAEIDFSFQCLACPLQFTSRSGLNHHITSSHKTDTETAPAALDEFLVTLIAADSSYCPQTCLICQETMNNQFELEIHTIEHQKEFQTTESESIQFACPKCCRLFFGRDGKSYLKDHYNIIHLEKQPPTCEECNSKFSSTVCYTLHRKSLKNCSKKCSELSKIEDPYEKLNDPIKLAFVCSRCQTLIAGESAESRFDQHQAECNKTLNDDFLQNISQAEVDKQ